VWWPSLQPRRGRAAALFSLADYVPDVLDTTGACGERGGWSNARNPFGFFQPSPAPAEGRNSRKQRGSLCLVPPFSERITGIKRPSAPHSVGRRAAQSQWISEIKSISDIYFENICAPLSSSFEAFISASQTTVPHSHSQRAPPPPKLIGSPPSPDPSLRPPPPPPRGAHRGDARGARRQPQAAGAGRGAHWV